VGRKAGLTQSQLLGINNYHESDSFSSSERLILEYADAMTKTPVDVPDYLFARLNSEFSHGQIVELTSAIAWENYRARFNHALGIESQHFAAGGFCALPSDGDPRT
jgi:4-carboxymuconolactone decarboxylase